MESQDQAIPAVAVEKPARDRWPSQIKFIVGNEAAERFSYYGMLSILAIYISGGLETGGLAHSRDSATSIVHTFKFVNYFLPLFGAWLSDKIIGRYHTILWISLFYCLGHGVLACSDFASGPDGKLNFLYVGLGLIAFGSGGIKPCVSAFMGDQFRTDQSHLLQKAYGAFYWSINFGSFFGFLIIPWIKNKYHYSWAFAVPGIAMAIATIIFWSGTPRYVRKPPTRQNKHAGFIPVYLSALANQPKFSVQPIVNICAALVLPLISIVLLAVVAAVEKTTPVLKIVGWAGLSAAALWYIFIIGITLMGKFELPEQFWQAARKRHTDAEINGARSVNPILFVFALVPVFWSLFDQTNSTWVLQGEQMLKFNLLGLEIDAERMQSANALLVMIMVPILTLLVYPRIGKFATPLKRMSFGLFLTAASYVVVALIQQKITGGAKLSVAWQIVPYIVLTLAEVLVSTTGLEFAFTEAAPEMKSTIMSFWLITVAMGNLLVASITKVLSTAGSGHSDSVSTSRFLLYAAMTFGVAILFSFVASRYRYRAKHAGAA